MNPQHKKEQFYKHERRNNYGQNAKASLKCIRRRKKMQARAARRQGNQVLISSLHDPDAMSDSVLLPISYLQPVSYISWSKAADEPLGKHLAHRLNHAITKAVLKYQSAIPDLLPLFLTRLSTVLHEHDLNRYQHTLTVGIGQAKAYQLPLNIAREAWRILRGILAENGIEPLARRRTKLPEPE